MRKKKPKPIVRPRNPYLNYGTVWVAYRTMRKKRRLKKILRTFIFSKPWAIHGDLKYGTSRTVRLLQERELNGRIDGAFYEPMYSRNDGYSVYIATNQIAQIFEVSERTAQRMLATTRKLLNKDRLGFVSVKEFCYINKLNEDEVRNEIKKIYPDFRPKEPRFGRRSL